MIQSTGSRKAHHECAPNVGQKWAQAIITFFNIKWGHLVPVALKLYKAKTISLLICGIMLGPVSSNFAPLEKIQSKVFHLSNGVSNAVLRLETGLIRIEVRVSLMSVITRLNLAHSPSNCTSLILKNRYYTQRIRVIHQTLSKLGIWSSPDNGPGTSKKNSQTETIQYWETKWHC